jgi:hypothetical protein
MELSGAFFHEVVKPLADARLGQSEYAAALVGGGSEVLGLDSEVSADHDWGPRVTLFVQPGASAEAASIEGDLPSSFRGVTRRFGATAGGAPWVQPFEVSTVGDYFTAWLGFSDRSKATLVDGLARPAMSFLAVTAGAVFHDGAGELTRTRAAAAFYPDDVWRWLVACHWRRIAEEESFIERTAMVGDALGSRIVIGRVVRDAIRMVFLLDHRYPPYSKWLGAAFSTIPLAGSVAGMLTTAMSAVDGTGAPALSEALEIIGAVTNERLGTEVDPSRRRYFSRSMYVAPATEFVEAILATVADSRLQSLPTSIGNVDMLYGTNNGAAPRAYEVYEALLTPTRA